MKAGLSLSMTNWAGLSANSGYFFTNSTIPTGFNFTRASTATQNLNGTVSSYDIDIARLSSNGLRIESQRVNSAQNTTAPSSSNCVVTANAATDPMGGNTANLLTASAGTFAVTNQIVGTASNVGSTTTLYTLSIYVKPGTLSFVQLTATSGVFSTKYANFDLSTATITATSEVYNPKIDTIGNGWYRISVSLFANLTGTSNIYINPIKTTTAVRNASATWAGTETIYYFGAQIEQSTYMSSYIPTTTASVTRSADKLTIGSPNDILSAAQGTMLVEFWPRRHNGSSLAAANSPVIFKLGTSAHAIAVRGDYPTSRLVLLSSGLTNSADMNNLKTVPFDEPSKIALTWGQNNKGTTNRSIAANNTRLGHFKNTTTELYHHCTTLHKVAGNANYSTIQLHYENIYADFSGETNGTATGTLKASIQVGSTITAADATVSLSAGGSATLTFTGLNLTAGTVFYVHTRLAMPAGSKDVIRSAMGYMPIFDNGGFFESSGTVDITATGVPYGATALAALTSGSISAMTLQAGGSGYTNATSDVYAWEKQSNGVIAYKQIGTATNTAGAVTSLTLTDGTPPTGVSAWVEPNIVIVHGGLQTEATRTTLGFAPNAITGIPSQPVRSLWTLGDSITIGSQTGHLTDEYGNNGNFEFAADNRFGLANGGVAGLNVYNLFEVGKTFTRTLGFYATYCTDVLVCLGINDIAWNKTASDTIANLQALQSLISGLGLRVRFATITPRSTSTDNWTTVVNQSTVTINSINYANYQNAVNTAISSGAILSDENGYIDFNALISSGSVFSATPDAVTSDGLHPSDNVGSPSRSGVARSKLNATFYNSFAYLLDTANWLMSVNGEDVVQDNLASLMSGTLTTAVIGGDTVNQIGGWIRKVNLYPTKKTAAQLKTLSTTTNAARTELSKHWGSTLACFGDSITAGQGASTPFPTLLGNYLGRPVLNQGIAGTPMQNTNSAATGLPVPNNGRDRYTSVTGIGKKDLLTIMYGLNDLGYTGSQPGWTLALYINDYQEVLNGLLSSGYTKDSIVLCSPTWIPDDRYNYSANFTGGYRGWHLQFVAAVRQLAVTNGLLYADTYAAIRDNGGTALLNAGTDIHPNDAGHVVIANTIMNATYVK